MSGPIGEVYREGREVSDNVDSDPAGNPYAAPLSLSGEETTDDDRKSVDADLRACVGPNADYYLRQWHGVLRGRNQGTGFNWAAFLLSGLWLPYRKMYLATLIFYSAIIAEMLLEGVLEVAIESPPPPWLDRVTGLAFAIVCGAFGNRWYLSHVTKVIARSRSDGLIGRDLKVRIARRGGTSLVAPLATFALFMATIFAVAFAFAVLFPDDEVVEELMLPEDET
jgi:hypothetical protein